MKDQAPRHAAAKMVTLFIDGKPSEEPLNELAEPLRGLARTHARNAAAIIVHHARRVRSGEAHYGQIPRELRGAVTAYNKTKARQAEETKP